MSLGVFYDRAGKAVTPRYPDNEGIWSFDEDDYLLMAMLADPIYCAELLGSDPMNHEYGGCFTVRDYQWPLFRTPDNYVGHTCARTVGKALADDAPVLTPAGYVPVASLHVGDLVVGSDGMPTPVLGVHPQEGARDIYSVRFRDGAVVDCDDEHLWTVTCDSWQGRGTGERTLPLRELRRRRADFKVRLPDRPVEFVDTATPVMDPWMVGALIGDGNLTRPTMIRFSSIDEENVERLRAALPADTELVHDSGCDYRLRAREYVFAGYQQGRVPHSVLQWTRAAGLHGKGAHEKRIPHVYKWGSVPVRLGVLRGLVDTDGSVTHGGSVEICTASEELADDIRHIALSLGGRASITRAASYLSGIRHRDRFRVVFRLPTLNPCLLARKAAAYAKAQTLRKRDCDWRRIASITLTGRRTATCIEVAAVDGLFMADDFVLTHNTESIKWKSVSHGFRRIAMNLLLTAPELIHLLPLTDAIEDKIRSTRLTREFLETRGGKTGFTHRPFGVDFMDGTKIVGRIPRVTGTGVKGQHQPDLIVDEGQDYPEKGWIEVHETVMKDTVDIDGNPDFTYQFYGVHSGARDTGFHKRAAQGAFKIVQITALQRPGWGKQEKQAAKAAYGGTSAPDYRRNILGEPGAAASAYFVTSRLVACVDQDRETNYNQIEYRHQTIKVEEFDELMLPIGEVLDLPTGYSELWAGMDVGLTNSPTVIMLFASIKERGVPRMKLIRRFTLERMRTRQIREATYAIAHAYGGALKGFGMDVTGLGFPMWQEMEDDEAAPPHLLDVARGYFFNAKVPVDVKKEFVTTDSEGRMRDQFGAAVVAETDPLTGITRYITSMPMIEASTRYLREWVDSTFLLLPFDTEITSDMQGETQQRVKRISGLKNKPNAFHILDAMRTAAMAYRAGDIEEALAGEQQVPVLDLAL